ncbi:MAG: glycoside hydrolase [Chloroflexi bacterium]|nr:glycoside hydrolase [Chloroflexota bacterium]
MPPLHVAIIWHMHQPYYRQPGTSLALLPWVRLHATKDYLHMAEVAAVYPDVHVTFTIVPSLAEQLADYARGELQDRLMVLAKQPYFSPDDKRYLLNICFSIDWQNVIRRYPPYAFLLDRRHLALLNPDYFSDQTYRDLIVWFSLAWTDPNLLEKDENLRELVRKGRNFSIAEAVALLEQQRQLISQILPRYRRLQEEGQMELITVPYFHPILPLVVDTDIGRRPTPGLPVPKPPFRAPEDAQAQIDEAVALHQQKFGELPRGLWPSEGAVSPEILPLVAAAGIRWLASDEAILGRSLGVFFERDRNGLVTRPEQLYRPYRVPFPGGELIMVFRDHHLSDRVGFTYQGLGGEQAAEDMIVRLKQIHHALRHQSSPGLVSIILDGENAWEHFEHNGDVFLHALYRRMQDDPDLQAVTVSEHLQQVPPTHTLDTLASGSWIRGDFSTWIGDPEHIEAWSRLRDVRNAYQHWKESQPAPEKVQEVQRYLWAAEGSDWFWWYSRYNTSDQDALFDQAFLDLLAAAYNTMGLAPPAGALTPIQGLQERLQAPTIMLTPQLTAQPDPREQWTQAQVIQAEGRGGTMQQAGGLVQGLRYGNDMHNLYLRLECTQPVSQHHIEINLKTPGGDYHVSLGRKQSTAFLYRQENGLRVSLGPVKTALAGTILEVALPLSRLSLLPLAAATKLQVFVHVDPHSAEPETFPGEHAGEISLVAG